MSTLLATHRIKDASIHALASPAGIRDYDAFSGAHVSQVMGTMSFTNAERSCEVGKRAMSGVETSFMGLKAIRSESSHRQYELIFFTQRLREATLEVVCSPETLLPPYMLFPFRGYHRLQEILFRIVSIACSRHAENRPVWKRPWFHLKTSHAKDQRVLWLFVNDVLLDSSNEALVLDCCIMPVERMDLGASRQLRDFIELSSSSNIFIPMEVNRLLGNEATA